MAAKNVYEFQDTLNKQYTQTQQVKVIRMKNPHHLKEYYIKLIKLSGTNK